MPRRRKQPYKGNSLKKNILLFLLAISILLVISFIAKKTDTRIQQIASEGPKDSLQIGRFIPTQGLPDNSLNPTKSPQSTHTPTPTIDPRYCEMYKPLPKDRTCECPIGHTIQKLCDQGIATGIGIMSCETPGAKCPTLPGKSCTHPDKNGASTCFNNFDMGTCVEMCYGKPIIYLYPEYPMFVDVEIKTTGNIFISDPLYPAGGWKQVLAFPNGNLTYQGKSYKELFYETKIQEKYTPDSGITINSKNIYQELDAILSKLGLTNYEKKEFLDYWVPRLNALNSPYIQFSLIQGEFKEKTDKVIITPQPDTFIEILAYFKPLDKPYQGSILNLPITPPERIGFTAVEWGGTIVN